MYSTLHEFVYVLVAEIVYLLTYHPKQAYHHQLAEKTTTKCCA